MYVDVNKGFVRKGQGNSFLEKIYIFYEFIENKTFKTVFDREESKESHAFF